MAPSLPPYGFMGRDYESDASYYGRPVAWPKGVDFDAWLAKLGRTLSDDAWPAWDVAAADWEPSPARSRMVDLTLADLDIIARLQKRHHRAGDYSAHSSEWWFLEEDDLLSRWDERYHDALSGCGMSLADFKATFSDGALAMYAGGIHLALKRLLQRPRPFQAAYLLGRPSPSHRHSGSAWSPSAISGHAFQGLLGCAYVLHVGIPDVKYRKVLLQMAVDIGDRRVLAGLHYPSDNAMSWRAALELLRVVGIDAALHAQLGAAIQDGIVWREMVGSDAHKHCVEMVRKVLPEGRPLQPRH